MNSFAPRITVATIVEQEGRFLFVEELQGEQLVLNQPAGHVEKGESLPQAAFRETLEETAWTVEIGDLVGIYIYQPRPNAGVYYRFCFVGKPLRHDRYQKLDSGIQGAVWLTAEELANRHQQHRSPLVAKCLEDYLAGQRLPQQAVYQHPWPLQPQFR